MKEQMIARYKNEGQEKGTGITCIDQHFEEWIHDTDDSKRERVRRTQRGEEKKREHKKNCVRSDFCSLTSPSQAHCPIF